MIECLHFCFSLNYTSIRCFTLIVNITLFPIKRDVSQFFIVNSSTGYLLQGKRFDYEDTAIQCGLGKGGGYLNITAEVTPYITYTGIFYMKKGQHKFLIHIKWMNLYSPWKCLNYALILKRYMQCVWNTLNWRSW